MKNPPFKTLSTEISWRCPWYQIASNRIRLPNGDETDFHVVEKQPAVFIVPVTEDGEIPMLYQYRYTVQDYCWELPAGSIKPGQSPQQAAIDELREEVGGAAKMWRKLGEFYTGNGICNEIGHFYLATGVTLSDPNHEAAEIIEIHPMPIKRALGMLHTGKITDLPSATALYLCQNELQQWINS